MISRITYTYDDGGLAVKKEYDCNTLESWNDELGMYELIFLPCDGVVDSQIEYAYDEYGNPTKFFDASWEIPDNIIKEIARCLLPDIVSYCESEAGKAEFERWKAQQSEIQKSKAG